MNNTVIIIGLSFLILFGFVLLAILYLRSRIKQRLNQELEKKVKERTFNLEATAMELEKINHELDTFIYKTSHDLKSPLTTLEGLCRLILLEDNEEMIHLHVSKQQEVIALMQLLLFRVVEIGDIRHHQVQNSNIRLKRYIKKMLRSMSKTRNFDHISFKIDVPPEFIIKTDIEMLDILLGNVIKNAIENSKPMVEGEEKPYVQIVSKESKRSWKIMIVDNGIGIHPEISQKIFEMFFRGQENPQNFGLGLYKAQIASKKIRGDIKLSKSSAGKTMFVVNLPKID